MEHTKISFAPSLSVSQYTSAVVSLSLPYALLIMTSSEVREGDWTTGNFREILGLKIPAYFTSDPQLLSNFITNLQTRPDDVFIASYPKSGESKLIRWFDTYLQNLTLVALYKASLHKPGLILSWFELSLTLKHIRFTSKVYIFVWLLPGLDKAQGHSLRWEWPAIVFFMRTPNICLQLFNPTK